MSIEQAFKYAMKKSEEANPIKDGDYVGEDGLWYCGNCHTRKQSQITVLGKVYRPFCTCACEEEKKNAEEEERKQREFAEKVKELRRAGFPDKEMLQWTFANDDMENEQITKAMKRYVENFPELKKQGKGLLLYGNVGRGKTYAACEVANALIDKGYSVLVTNFSRVLNTLQGTFDKQEYIDSLNRYDLRIIDDLGAERQSEFMREMVFNIIDSRYRSGRPFIITTNLTADELKKPQEVSYQRIYDRILERCFPVKVDGVSRRRTALIETHAQTKAMLGL
jgi:DNA replication protein DnaC